MTTDLKRLALAAKNSEWTSQVWFGTNEDSWTATGPIHEFGDDPYEPIDPDSEPAQAAARDSAFIAAASPDVVLALLERVEAAEAPEAHWECQQKIDRLEEDANAWSCPDCAFTFCAHHTNADGSLSCPLCESMALAKQLSAAMTAKEELAEIAALCCAPEFRDTKARISELKAVGR